MMGVVLRTAKEFVRHIFLKLGAEKLFDLVRPRSAVRGDLLKLSSRRERFSRIYGSGLWQHEADGTPPSGEGSSLAATASLRSRLPLMLDQLGVRTLVDVGCGDFTWMRTVELSQHYAGVDVVPAVIEANRLNCSNDKRDFFCLDVTEDELPDGDAILCREILFHLSFSDIKSVLANCAAKKREYLLATTDSSTLFNSDIRSGDFRRLNLLRPPISLPRPDHVIEDDAIEKGRVIGVWRWYRLPKFWGSSHDSVGS